MLGITGVLSNKQLEMFRHLTRYANASEEAASSIMGDLGFIAKNDGDQEAFARFKVNAGQLSIEYLVQKGILEHYSMTLAEYNDALDKSAPGKEEGKTKVKFLKLTKKGQNLLFKEDSIIKEYDARIKELEDENIIGVPDNYIKFSDPKSNLSAKDTPIKRNPFMNPPQLMADGLNALKNQEHNILLEEMEMLLQVPKKDILKQMGYISENELDEDTALSFDDKESQKAANREKETEYDELKILYDDIKEGRYLNNFWLNYSTSRNGRIGIESVRINPMDNKELHRWLISPKHMTQKYSVEDITNATLDNPNSIALGFKVNIAQAFGMSTDKMQPKEIIAYADELLNMKLSDIKKKLKGEKPHFPL